MKRAACIWIAAYGLLIGLSLDNTRPYKGDETYYTVSAISMIEEGDYLIPSYQGIPRFQKPPLAYWMVTSGYTVFGIGLWSARILFLVLACATLYLTYRLTLLLTGAEDHARFNLILLASAPMFVAFSRIAMTDLPLTFFLTAALYFFIRSLVDPDRLNRDYFLAYLCMGFAALSKGTIGLLPIPVMFISLLLTDRPDRGRYLIRLVNPLLLLTTLLIAAPWYIYAYLQYGPQILAQSGREADMTFGSFDRARSLGHFIYYLGVILRYYIPFTLLAIVLYVRKRPKLPSILTPILVFAIAAFAVFVLVVNDHRSRYLLILFPSLTIIAGHLIYPTRWRIPAKRLAIGLFLLQILVLTGVPRVAGEPVRTLVGYWRENLIGTLSVYALDDRERGWAEVFSRGELIDSPERSDFVLTESDTIPLFAGYRTVRTEERIGDLRFESPLNPVPEKTRYFLLERPR